MKWLLGISAVVLAPIALLVFLGYPDETMLSSQKVYRRVIALAPSMTETMIALGQTHRLVGVTTHCSDARVQHLAKIGSFAEPNFEAIMAEQPDLVLGVPHVMAKRVLDKIAKNGIEVFAHQPDSLGDIKYIVSSLASLFSIADEGHRLNDQIDRSIVSARIALYQMLTQQNRRTALVAVANSPLVVAGRSTFASQIIEEIGLSNLASSKNAWPIWPVEKLLTDPPAFLILAGGAEALPNFQSIFTSLGLDLKRSQITLVVPEQPIFYSPSPNIIKDIETLTDLFLADV